MVRWHRVVSNQDDIDKQASRRSAAEESLSRIRDSAYNRRMKAGATKRDHAPVSLYDMDFHLWTQRTAALLRAGRFAALDVEHTAEEVEDMGKREVRELDSRVRVLLLHLLKWQYQPRRRSRSWASTIAEQRDAIADSLTQSPSLRRHVGDQLADSYRRAARRAALETGLAIRQFPSRCPYTVAQLLDEAFLPENIVGR